MKINVYMMNDFEWYAGKTAEECLVEICKDWDCSTEFFIFDNDYVEPLPLTNKEMEKLLFRYDVPKGIEVTFKYRLKELIDIGTKFPCFFASTEY